MGPLKRAFCVSFSPFIIPAPLSHCDLRVAPFQKPTSRAWSFHSQLYVLVSDLTKAAWLRPHQSMCPCRQVRLVQSAEPWASGQKPLEGKQSSLWTTADLPTVTK